MNWLKLGALLVTLSSSAFSNAQERNVNAAYRDADVRTIIQQLGQVIKSPVVIEEGVEGKVTFLTNGAVTADEYRTAVLSLLADLGYQITKRDGALIIGPIKQ